MEITRRLFLKSTLATLGGVALSQYLKGDPVKVEKSRVVLVRHPRATDGGRAISRDIVQRMLDNAIKRLTGKSSVAEAWSSLLPGFRPHHLIAIKVNAIPPGKLIPTHPEVVEAIVSGLRRMGAKENNIIIYDRQNEHLSVVGYRVNTSSEGVRCFGTDEEGWGYDKSQPVEISGRRYYLSSILTRCDHLINVPVLKVHLDPYGVTLSLKNHFGSVDRPRELHKDFAVTCAAYILRFRSDQMLPEFFALLTQTQFFKQQLERCKRGTGTVTVPQRLLRD